MVKAKSVEIKAPVKLKELISDLISEKRKYYQHLENISFKLSEDSTNEVLATDGAELARHLSNLADNAVEAVGLGGEITFKITSDENLICIQISDTGCGIPEEILSQIGKQKLSVGKSNGTGQGVYYARKFIKSIGGELKVESVLGIGSTFKFVFSKSDRLLLLPESKTIVYVDDDPLTHEPWLDFFKKNNSQVIETKIFKTSASYLSWAENAPTHTLFSDYNLKEGATTGLDVIAKASPKTNYSYLITNSYDDPAVQQDAKEQGVCVVPKNKLDEFKLIWI